MADLFFVSLCYCASCKYTPTHVLFQRVTHVELSWDSSLAPMELPLGQIAYFFVHGLSVQCTTVAVLLSQRICLISNRILLSQRMLFLIVFSFLIVFFLFHSVFLFLSVFPFLSVFFISHRIPTHQSLSETLMPCHLIAALTRMEKRRTNHSTRFYVVQGTRSLKFYVWRSETKTHPANRSSLTLRSFDAIRRLRARARVCLCARVCVWACVCASTVQ